LSKCEKDRIFDLFVLDFDQLMLKNPIPELALFYDLNGSDAAG
jgi:hypothetical protein